ncbi:MAG: ABC transporter permease [Candidatus Thermoplasmatota archaeon]|nr:ABC transporter permease [Candidatus Thermoplasmatota archaeon]
MMYYVLKRLLFIIPTLIGLSIFAFILMSVLPQTLLEAQFINPNSTLSISVQLHDAAVQLGLNYPKPVQYFFYINGLLHGNFGFMNTSFYSGPVLTGIEEFFPNTVQLVVISLIVSLLIAIPLGTYIGNNPGSLADHAGRIFTLTGFAMPAFWLGLMLQILFGKGILGLPISVFPISGIVSSSAVPNPLPPWLHSPNSSVLLSTPTHMILIDALIHGDFTLAYSALLHLVLPVATLSYALIAGIIRFMRAGIVDASRQEFVKTARAKGVPEKLVLKRHIRKNGLTSTITVVGLLLADLLGGVVLVETVFQYPGMGLLSVNAALYFQIYGVMGTTIVFGFILMVVILLTDIAYAYIDPRIRYE